MTVVTEVAGVIGMTRVTGLTTDAIQGCFLKVELMVASNQDI